MENFQYNKGISTGKFSVNQKAILKSIQICCGKHILEYFQRIVNRYTEYFPNLYTPNRRIRYKNSKDGGETMESNNKMISLFNAVADLTLERIEKEKETNLSEETYRMISLTQSLHSSIICSAQTPQLF